jgi:hypothetical protein
VGAGGVSTPVWCERALGTPSHGPIAVVAMAARPAGAVAHSGRSKRVADSILPTYTHPAHVNTLRQGPPSLSLHAMTLSLHPRHDQAHLAQRAAHA